MDEEELRGPVLCVLRRLLLPDLAQVPHVEAAVGPGGGQDRLVVGGPLDLLKLGGNIFRNIIASNAPKLLWATSWHPSLLNLPKN